LSISKTRIPAMTGTFALPGPCRTTSSDRYCNDGARFSGRTYEADRTWPASPSATSVRDRQCPLFRSCEGSSGKAVYPVGVRRPLGAGVSWMKIRSALPPAASSSTHCCPEVQRPKFRVTHVKSMVGSVPPGHGRLKPAVKIVGAGSETPAVANIADVIGSSDVRAYSEGVSTGFADLDDSTGGFLPGTLWLVLGTPGVGRTLLATQFATVVPMPRDAGWRFIASTIARLAPCTAVTRLAASSVSPQASVQRPTRSRCLLTGDLRAHRRLRRGGEDEQRLPRRVLHLHERQGVRWHRSRLRSCCGPSPCGSPRIFELCSSPGAPLPPDEDARAVLLASLTVQRGRRLAPPSCPQRSGIERRVRAHTP
jgi:hypothetical protein